LSRLRILLDGRIIACLLLIIATGAEAYGDAVKAQLIASVGKGRLYRVGEQKVLVLSGTPYEMGLQHGKLLSTAIAEDMKAVLEWTAERECTREKLGEIYRRLEPNIPKRYLDELKGIAEGSGVPLEDLQLVHAMPSRFHCSGAAVYGKATINGKLYHTRSLDYSLTIGKTKRLQDNSLVIIYKPNSGNAHAVLSWAGFVGCVSGMNEKGISVGEMGSSSNDESYDGNPMIFALRDVLYDADTLSEAIRIMREMKRTCGYNFIFADGKIPDAVAVEVTKSLFRALRAQDEENNAAPHWGIEDVVRRVNHFVSPATAATQRKVYDPRKSEGGSWLGYKLISDYIQANYGKLDEYKMIELLRMYPPEHSCLHQAVFCPSELRFWASFAKDPHKVRFAGAQNQAFYRYDLEAILQGASPDALTQKKPALQPTGEAVAFEQGKIEEQKEVYSTKKGAEYFAFQPTGFEWKMVLLERMPGYDIYLLSFPTALRDDVESNNTVYAEYYRPTRKGKVPGVVVLHIAGGNFEISRVVSRYFASNGIAALFVQMAYYGYRKPKNMKRLRMVTEDIDRTIRAVRQTVMDVRRAGLWLSKREEIDANRIGVCGTSLGSFVTALVAECDNRFRRAAVVLGGGDIAALFWYGKEAAPYKKKLVEKGFTEESLREMVKPVDPLTYAHLADAKNVIMFNAKNDTVVPVSCTRKLWEAMGKPRIFWYDADHYSMLTYLFEVMNKLVGFFGVEKWE